MEFDQQFGFAGVERAESGVAIPTGKYIIIIPQEDLTITSISASPGYTATNYSGKTLKAGIPFYLPHTTCTLSGNADVYKTVRMRSSHEKVQ